ncbi:unnamed protein product [Ixodes hexagonus]
MAFFRQLRVILWKNIVVYSFKRHYFLTFFTMLIPLVLSAVLVYLRSLGLADSTEPIVRMNATLYPEFTPRYHYRKKPTLVVYAPYTTYTGALMDSTFPGSKGFPTQVAMEAYIANTSVSSELGTQLAVIFDKASENGSVPRDLSYTVRFNNTDYNFHTGDRYPLLKTQGPRDDSDDLYRQMFWALQEEVFKKHVDLLAKAQPLTRKSPKISMNRFPYPEYNDDSKFGILSRLIAMFVVYGYLVFSPIYVRRIITEKSSRVRELMRMMGLSDWVYWIGTFASGFLVLAVTSVISLVLFKIEVAPMAAVLLYSDFSLLLFIMLLYSTAAILFLLLFTVLFNNAVVGVIFSTVAWVLSFSLPTTLLDPLGEDKYMGIGRSVKLATSLLPNSGLYWCYRLIAYFEGQGKGASWANMNSQAVPADNVTLLDVVLVMIASVFMYGVLLWYLDNVWPYQYGIPKHPLYFLQKSYWYSSTDYDSGSDTEAMDEGPPDVFEAPLHNIDSTISLSHVTKRFNGANKNAVDDLSLKIYDGQITVLLGHNGAGKTTTMNMITGLFPPTNGRIHIGGYNILTQTKKARENFGLCPQHNVLFDEMTVEEHLYFFYSLKDSPEVVWKEHIDEILANLELSDKRRTLAKGLSGGMKRKLSLGNSMIGGSKILILDEPTAGMDPQARRAVWTLLQELRREKTILLTTHYMEEADALGDRIAFVAGGKLQCCGSPLFLKKKFGTGYRMRIAKAHPCDLEALTQRITGTIMSSHMASDIGHEVVYNLGFPPASDVIPLLRSLEQDKDSLGIASLGISVTTMEDVFIRVGELADMSMDNGSVASTMTNGDIVSDDSYPRFQRIRGRLPLLLQQASALFAKRANATRRQYFLPILTILIPIALFVIYALLDIKDSELTNSSLSRLAYDLGPFAGSTVGFVNTNETTPHLLTTAYESAMAAQKVNVKENVEDVNEFLLNMARKSLSEYESKYLVGGRVEGDAKLVAWYNGEPLHLGAMSLNLAHTAALRFVTGDPNAKVSVTNWPMPGRLTDQLLAGMYDQASRILCAVFVPTALAFLSSSFVLFPTHERVTKAKLLQLMAGVPGVLFWGTTFIWDFLIFAICSTAIMVPLFAINPNGIFLSSAEVAGATYFLLLLYGWAAIPFSYLFSYVKKTPSAGYALLTTVNVITGVMLSIVISVVSFLGKLKVFGIDEDALAKSMWVLRLVPGFSVTWGFANIHEIGGDPHKCAQITPDQLRAYCPMASFLSIEVCCQECPGGPCFKPRSAFSFAEFGAGREMALLFIVGILLFALLAFFESNVYGIWYSIKSCFGRNGRGTGTRAMSESNLRLKMGSESASAVVEDSDVAKERAVVEELVRTGRVEDEALVALNLKRWFRALQAVDNLTFRVHKNECFGLLGVNGAGKTTTFRMLTGDLPMSSGNAYIGSANLQHQLKKFQSMIGYCPQFDAQIDKLTGRETLEMFALIRGVPRDQVPNVVNYMISLADLELHADKPTEAYRQVGGSRRKLSIAMALIGNPPVVFLDEPTAGVDPAARRKIWQGLDDVQKLMGAAVILTSHSMEECEALCQRISIMVNGSFRCMGSTQHLKSKFGQGFTVLIKLSHDQAVTATASAIADICNAMEEAFPGYSELRDSHQTLLHFHLTDLNVKWSDLFETMEGLKQRLQFEDYIVSDTTLEQIFLAFARAQRDVDDTTDTMRVSA